ncbi:MAG TPA: hypothetical protein VFG04_08345 [Planctomycetaceae bacterium]|nr:hypothetical protein [Planctomycetaceae bacterium]
MRSDHRWQRIVPTLGLLVFLSAALGLFSAVAYSIGRCTDSDLRFLEPRRAPTLDEACIAYPIEYCLRSNENNQVIFLGDSTCRCGIDPAEFERLSGLRAYNLGSQGKAGPLSFALTVKAYLASHPSPQFVVLSISPLVCEMAGNRRDAAMQDRLLANYGAEVSGILPWSESLLYLIKRGSLDAWANRSTAIAGHNNDVRDVPLVGLEAHTYRSLKRVTRESRGFGRLPGFHHAGGPVLARIPPQVTVRDDWRRGVSLLAETCQALRVPLLLRFSPMPIECSKMRDFSTVEDWARELGSSCPELTVGHPALLWYDWNLCWDAYHLNAQGVSKYTAVLAVEVRTALARVGRAKRL